MGLKGMGPPIALVEEKLACFLLVSRSLESGGCPWRYSRIGVAVYEMRGISGVHVAILILGFQWQLCMDGTV